MHALHYLKRLAEIFICLGGLWVLGVMFENLIEEYLL